TTLWLLRRSCEMAQLPDQWFTELHALALSSLPFLDARTAVAFLDAAVPARCLDRASPRLRSWLDLYRAVAGRDALRMGQAAESLLEANEAMDPAMRQYVLAAAMLGGLADRHPEQVIQLWENHRDLADDINALPDLRLILNMALSQQSESAANGR
ncbi:MAG TPA: hypothetical protein VJA26_07900, partial [Gammaproteobacteria bacterium]|nr:hypothetical protein [Gammaproteobacteria bacterium]